MFVRRYIIGDHNRRYYARAFHLTIARQVVRQKKTGRGLASSNMLDAESLN